MITKDAKTLHSQSAIAAAEQLGLDQSELAKVLQITHELYGNLCGAEVDLDPELPEDRFLLLHVNDRGSSEEVARRHATWHEATYRAAPDLCRVLRLSVNIEP